MLKNAKHISNIDKNCDFAEMFIYDEIGDDKVNGSTFAYEMRYLREYEKVKCIKVKINSVGGSVMHAKSIISEMLDAIEAGVCVETYGNGLMASSAGLIFMVPPIKDRYAKDYARLMVHGVSYEEDEELTEQDKANLQQFQKILIQIFANRTGKKEKFFEDLMGNGQDNWFTTKEMIKSGLLLAENIEDTKIDVSIDDNTIKAGAVAVRNKMMAVVNKHQEEENVNQNPLKMKKVIALLSLQEGAAEEVVEAAVKDTLNKLKDAQDKAKTDDETIKDLRNKLETANSTIAANQEQAATDYVKNLVKEGTIEPSKEAEALVEAKKDLNSFRNSMKLISPKSKNIIDKIDTKTGDDQVDEAIKGKSFRQLEKENPKALNALKVSNKAAYVDLYNKEYGTKKTEADL